MRRRVTLGRFALAASFLLLLLFFGSRFSPGLRHPVDSLLLAQGMLDVRSGGWLSHITKKPLRDEVSFDGVVADSYSPRDSVGWGDAPARGCVVLVHGMTTMGKADHRLVAFAESLVRLGFTALVPDLPGMKRFRPEEADIARIERAFSWMTRGGAGSYERCSLLAFSFAAGPALRAAARPAVGGKMAAFIGVGAYYDLKNVLKHLTTSGGQNRPAFPGGLPIRHGKWLFLRYNTELLGLEAHWDSVEALVSRKRKDEAADVSDLLAGMPEGARALLALMENKSPERFEALYARQGAAQRARLREWGMRDVVPGVRGKKFFLHGREDPFIPPSESVLLANRARETSGGEASAFVFGGFRHVGIEADLFSLAQILEGARFLGFVSAVLSAMEER